MRFLQEVADSQGGVRLKASEALFFSEVLPTPDFKGSKQSHCHCYWRSLIPGDQESVRVHACVCALTVDVKRRRLKREIDN